MKKKFVLTTIISLFLAVVAVSAQTKAKDFSGVWTLDVSKSKLPEQMRIESMTIKVTQTDKEIKIESATKRAARPNDAPTDGNRGGRSMGRGGFGGDGTITYSLDGKETTGDFTGGMASGKETRKATVASDGKLSLTTTRNLETQMGSATIKTNETWELTDAGDLKVTRYMETPRGATNADLYFTKKSSGQNLSVSATGSDNLSADTNVAPSGNYKGTVMSSVSSAPNSPSGSISGGILNGKAISLTKPEYPAAAKAVKAGGAVNVQVTIDEQGNIVSASAVSGHPLLRQAAEAAARSAKFAPTLLEGKPVMVTGVIVYNFVP